MNDNFINTIRNKPSSPAAFIFYRSKTKGTKEEVFYNKEALNVLSISHKEKKVRLSSFISTLCENWKDLLYKRLDALKDGHDKNGPGAEFVDVLQSGQRQYTVHGMALSREPAFLPAQADRHLFTIDRINAENLNLSRIFRQWKLSPREQEIAQALIEGKSNKQIAGAIGLSVNTIKAYLRLLTIKLGVSGRVEMVARILKET